jgi:hypothetical protein
VADCNEATRHPGFEPEQLDPSYYSFLGLCQLDRFHASPAGNEALGGCLTPLLRLALGD